MRRLSVILRLRFEMRLDFIDGLRGFFALFVAFSHYTALFCKILPEGFHNSSGSVCGFFVITGFVLARRFWIEHDYGHLATAALRRYFRLTIAPCVSIIFAYMLMKFHVMFNSEVCALTNSVEFMRSYYNFVPSFKMALREGLWGMYFSYDQVNSYNPVLWTMEYELKGSVLIFAFLSLFGVIKNRVYIYAVLIMISFDTLYLPFIFGVMISDLMYSAECEKYREYLKARVLFQCCIFIAGIFLYFYALDSTVSLYGRLQFGLFEAYNIPVEQFYHIIGASMIIFAIFHLEILQRFFSLKFFTIIGKYSFSLYLIHAPILLSVGGFVFLSMVNHGLSLAVSILGGVLSAILITVPTTLLLHRFVDIPAGRLAKRVGILLESR